MVFPVGKESQHQGSGEDAAQYQTAWISGSLIVVRVALSR